MSLTNKVEQFNNDSDLVHAFAHGDKGTVIQTEGGPVPSMARLADGIQTRLNETIDQQRVLEQRLAANSGATLVKTSSGRTVQEDLNAKASRNGDTAQDFYARNFQTGGTNNLTIAGGANPVAPTLTAAGAGTDISIGMVAKGGGRTTFHNAAGQHLQVGGYSAAQVMTSNVRVYGGPDGANPTFIAEGVAENAGIDFTAKGTGTFVYRSNGGIQFVVGNVAASVNYLRASGAGTGGGAVLTAEGTDTNVSMNLRTKGTGSIALQPGGRGTLLVYATANSVNHFEMVPNVTGSPPILRAAGSDTNVSMRVDSKGTGSIDLRTGGSTSFLVDGVASSVNYIATTPSVAGTSPRFTSTGSDTNVNMLLACKGSGQLFIDTPGVNLRGAAGSTERRLSFVTTTGNNYLYARDSDGVVGLYDVPGNCSPWYYTPATKTLTLGNASAVRIANRQETDLDALLGSCFFGFAGTATGAPAATGGYDAVGLQMSGAGQRTQLVLAGEADGLMLRTDDTPDGQNGWGTWRKVWDSSTLTKLSQLQNDLPQSSVSGNWVPLADTNATTAVAEVGFYNIFSQFPEYDEFRLVFENAKNAVVADAVMGVRVSTNGTSAVTSTTYFNGVDGVHLSNSMWAITSSYVQSGAYEFLLPRVRDIAVSFWAAGTKADSSRLGVDRMGGSTLSSNLTLTGIGFVFNGTTGTGRFRVFGRKYA